MLIDQVFGDSFGHKVQIETNFVDTVLHSVTDYNVLVISQMYKMNSKHIYLHPVATSSIPNGSSPVSTLDHHLVPDCSSDCDCNPTRYSNENYTHCYPVLNCASVCDFGLARDCSSGLMPNRVLDYYADSKQTQESSCFVDFDCTDQVQDCCADSELNLEQDCFLDFYCNPWGRGCGADFVVCQELNCNKENVLLDS